MVDRTDGRKFGDFRFSAEADSGANHVIGLDVLVAFLRCNANH